MDLAAPSTVGPYTVLEILGRGGMGVVYRARRGGEREVALKTVTVARGMTLTGIRREIHALARLSHPGIVKIVDQGVDGGVPWYAMELLSGRPLRAALAGDGADTRAGMMPTVPMAAPVAGSAVAREGSPATAEMMERAVRLIRRLCVPLAYLHGEGIVHRDLKPDNVLVGDDDRPVLVDFGLASAAGADASSELYEAPDGISGTVAYMAPEQALGESCDARADIYALGCILYELLAGRPPFVGDSAIQVLGQRIHSTPEPPSRLASGIAPRLEAIVLRMLEKEPRYRVGYAADVARMLDEVLPTPEPIAPEGRPYLFRPGFSDRDAEMAILRSRLGDLAERSGALVLLSGGRGIGRTRLLTKLGSEAAAARIQVFVAACREPDATLGSTANVELPLLLGAVADRCRDLSVDVLDRIVGSRGKVLAAVAPAFAVLPRQGLHPDPETLPEGAARIRLATYVADVIEELARVAPLVVIVDDLQWAGDVTLRFLDILAQRRIPGVLAAGSFRSEDVPAPLRDLASSDGVTHLALGRLEADAIKQIVGAMLGIEDPPRILLHSLTRLAEGIPFFLVEGLRLALAEGMLTRGASGRWLVVSSAADEDALPFPRSVHHLVERRLASLSRPARELLGVASVLGAAFTAEQIAALAAWPESSVFENIEELTARSVFEEGVPGSFRFSHASLREAAYRSLDAERRRALHGATIAVLGAKADPAVMARHHEGAGDTIAARAAYLEAARRARESNAAGEALGLYRAALALFDVPTRESVRAQIDLASRILGPSGKAVEAIALAEESCAAARDLGDDRLLSMALRRLATLYVGVARIDDAERAYLEALAIVRRIGHVGREIRILMGLARTAWDRGDTPSAEPKLEAALAMAREHGDLAAQATALSDLAGIREQMGRLDEARALLGQVLPIDRARGRRANVARTLANLGILEAGRGRYVEARAHFSEAREILAAVGDRYLEGVALENLANLESDLGNLERARQLFERAAAIAREVKNRRGESISLMGLAHTLCHLGLVEQAREIGADAVLVVRKVEDQILRGGLMAGLAQTALLSGEPIEAVEERLADASSAVARTHDARRAVLCAVIRGHVALARGQSAAAILSDARAQAEREGRAGSPDVADALETLALSQSAFERGAPLHAGFAVASLSGGLRSWVLAKPPGHV